MKHLIHSFEDDTDTDLDQDIEGSGQDFNDHDDSGGDDD